MTRPEPIIEGDVVDLASRRGDGRCPPFDREVEEALLGAMMLTKEARADADASGLLPSEFYVSAHSGIFAATMSLHHAGVAVDARTVADEIRRRGVLEEVGGAATLLRFIAEVPATTSAGRYAGIVRRLAQKRRLITLGAGIVELGYGHTADVDEATGKAQALVAEVARSTRKPARAAIDGASFVLDGPDTATALWGRGDEVLWPTGEALWLVGPVGVGKTTFAQQVGILGRLGLVPEVLGYPVQRGDRKVLYLAADRPQQARRSLQRMIDEEDREVLAERLVVWPGPPPEDLAAHPEALMRLAAEHDADTLVIDSVKDVALDLVKDETGARFNHAVQLAVAEGVEVLALHHQRKAQAGASKPRGIDDVYGSVWLTAGAGSVLLLWGKPGDPIVELCHLKVPVAEIGPLKVVHDHSAGTTTVLQDGTDALAMVLATPRGVTAQTVATAMFETTDPDRNQIEKARRRLDGLVAAARIGREDGQKGGAAGGRPALYRPVTGREDGS